MRQLGLLPVFLTMCALTVASAADYTAGDISGVSVQARSLGFLSQSWNAGFRTDSWTASERYELEATMCFDRGQIVPCGGFYGWYEFRDFDGKHNERGSMSSVGVGMQGGAFIGVIPRNKAIGVDIYPRIRAGLGGNDVSFSNIEHGGETYDLHSNHARFELGGECDAILTIARTVDLSLGVGAQFWSASNIYVSSTSSGGAVAVATSQAFNGTDVYAVAGLGLHF